MTDRDRMVTLAYGMMASMALLGAYFTVVGLAQGFDHAVQQFISLSYLMVPLVAGFGAQVSLYSYSRQWAATVHQGSASVAASGSMSTASMVACCVHHATDFVPFIGVTAVAAVLTEYQTSFTVVGLLSNLIGISMTLAVMQKHQLYSRNGHLTRIMRLDMRKVRNVVAGL